MTLSTFINQPPQMTAARVGPSVLIPGPALPAVHPHMNSRVSPRDPDTEQLYRTTAVTRRALQGGEPWPFSCAGPAREQELGEVPRA